MNWGGYEIGRLVACISDGENWQGICSVIPQKGRVYTIRATSMGENWNGEIILGLRFKEFQSLRMGIFAEDGGEWWFAAKDFRPLDDSRLDQFRRLLAPAPKTEVAL